MTDDEKNRIIVERMELFHKNAITASAVRNEISSIFDKIQQRRWNKIPEANIEYCRRDGLEGVGILQDDEF